MTIAEKNKLGLRINPDHVDDLMSFLHNHYGASRFVIVKHDHDSSHHLVASPRLKDIAHAFTSGCDSMNKGIAKGS